MKRFISVCVIFVTIFIFATTSIINQRNHYTITAKVVDVDRSTNTITFKDIETGNLWQADNIKDVWYSDICTLKINSNWTSDNIYDDTIEKATYICTPVRNG